MACSLVRGQVAYNLVELDGTLIASQLDYFVIKSYSRIVFCTTKLCSACAIKYPPKYSVSFIAKKIKGRTSRILRQYFPHLREWCTDHLWAPGYYHGSVGHGWEVVEKYIGTQNYVQKEENANKPCT